MKATSKVALTAIIATCAAMTSAHSPIFFDYFEYDPSNGGESVAPQWGSLTKAQRANGTPCVNGEAAGYPCSNVALMSFVARTELAAAGSLNDIWGWTDPITGDEIAIVGMTNLTVFVDITDPVNPVVLARLRGAGVGDTWRDMKVFNDHAFIVADGGGNANHGMQVFDLTKLRGITPGTEVFPDARHTGFGNAHNIAINEDTGFAYVVGANQCSGGLYMVDISTPTSPQFAGCFSSDGYTHDAQCVVYNGPDTEFRGREICVGYNEDTVTIIDVSDKQNATQLSRTPYPGSRYTHQGWFFDDNHSILIMNDELDEANRGINTTSYIFDVSDLNNPTEIGRYVGPTQAIDHNLYTRNGLIFESNYRAGLRILDGADIANGNLTEVGFFDVIPNSDSAQFSGTWSNYIYFASGNVILTDIGGGLFVVRPDDDILAPEASCLYRDDFENGINWTVGGNCSAGNFTVGSPKQIIDDGLTLQPNGAFEGDNAWFTAVNSSLGSGDVDGGMCEATSPVIDASGQTAVDVSLHYFFGQRDGGDDATDAMTIEILSDGTVVDTFGIGDVRNEATWRERVSQLNAPGQLQIRLRVADGAGAGDLIEAGIDNVSVCAVAAAGPTQPQPSDCSYVESFEAGADGWANSGSCAAGNWTAGIGRGMSFEDLITQPDSATDGTNMLFTASNTTVGEGDVDGGDCTVNSPAISVSQTSTLTMDWFHGQRDMGDDPGDLFSVAVSTDGGNQFETIVDRGDVRSAAQWQQLSHSIPAGSNVVLRAQCVDASGEGDLVECGIDNLRICAT